VLLLCWFHFLDHFHFRFKYLVCVQIFSHLTFKISKRRLHFIMQKAYFFPELLLLKSLGKLNLDMLSDMLHGIANWVIRRIWGDQILILGYLKIFIDKPVVDIGIKKENLWVEESALNLLFKVVYTCLHIMNKHVIVAWIISIYFHLTTYIIYGVSKLSQDKGYREIFHGLEDLLHRFELN